MPERRYFITGTDTGIGKTVVSAILMYQNPEFNYWKPVQSGLEDETDTNFIKRIIKPDLSRIIPEAYSLNAPRSPHEAAALDGIQIDIEKIRVPIAYAKSPLIIEGAGGLLVPLNNSFYIIDLINKFEAEAILVARSGLGTLNHTLLSLEALRKRNIPIKGVVLNGPIHDSNRETIRTLGNVDILAEIPPTDELSFSWIQNLNLKNLYL